MMKPRVVKLMADYGCHPLWEYGADGDLIATPDPAELPLAPNTINELKAWAAWFDTWVDLRDPYDSRRVLPEEERSFREAGRSLWRAMRDELGSSYRVLYFESGRVLEPEQDVP